MEQSPATHTIENPMKESRSLHGDDCKKRPIFLGMIQSDSNLDSSLQLQSDPMKLPSCQCLNHEIVKDFDRITLKNTFKNEQSYNTRAMTKKEYKTNFSEVTCNKPFQNVSSCGSTLCDGRSVQLGKLCCTGADPEEEEVSCSVAMGEPAIHEVPETLHLHDPELYIEVVKNTKSVPEYTEVAYPDYFGHIPPPFKEHILERPYGVQR